MLEITTASRIQVKTIHHVLHLRLLIQIFTSSELWFHLEEERSSRHALSGPAPSNLMEGLIEHTDEMSDVVLRPKYSVATSLGSN